MHIMSRVSKAKKLQLQRERRKEYLDDDTNYTGECILWFVACMGGHLAVAASVGLICQSLEYATNACCFVMLLSALFAIIPGPVSKFLSNPGYSSDEDRALKLRARMIMCLLSILSAIASIALLIVLSLTTEECRCNIVITVLHLFFLCVFLICFWALIKLLKRSISPNSYVRGFDYPWQ